MTTVQLDENDVNALNSWAADFGTLLANAQLAAESMVDGAQTPAARRAAEELLDTIKAVSAFAAFVTSAANTY